MTRLGKIPRQLLKVLGAATKLLVLTHENPDPDAIASGAALCNIAAWLGLDAKLAYGGIIGRAENKAMVDVLGIDISEFDPGFLAPDQALAIVDTQPDSGNLLLPAGIVPSIVVDHHPITSPLPSLPFVDVRPSYGATSTILTEYVFGLRLPVSPNLATALFYGIKTDTLDLGRHTIEADRHAYSRLWPLVDKEALPKIEYPRLPGQYFETFHTAMEMAYVYGDVVISNVSEMDNPSAVAEVADLLLRLEGITWSLCTGFYGDYLYVSLRTGDPDLNAGEMVRKVMRGLGSSGGHGEMAAGRAFVAANDTRARRLLRNEVEARFLRNVDADRRAGVKLLRMGAGIALAGTRDDHSLGQTGDEGFPPGP